MTISTGMHASLLGVLASSLLIACSATPPGNAATRTPTKAATKVVTIPNPASEHCLERGGKLVIVQGASGQRGMCHLPDGTVVEEWELLRRDEAPK